MISSTTVAYVFNKRSKAPEFNRKAFKIILWEIGFQITSPEIIILDSKLVQCHESHPVFPPILTLSIIFNFTKLTLGLDNFPVYLATNLN